MNQLDEILAVLLLVMRKRHAERLWLSSDRYHNSERYDICKIF